MLPIPPKPFSSTAQAQTAAPSITSTKPLLLRSISMLKARLILAAGEEALLGLAGAQFSEDDNVLVQGVEGSPYAIGYFGFAYFAENSGALKAVAVEGVEPSEATVDDGTYPLSRPLFIYSDANIMQEKPQVAAFIYFYLTNVDDNIVDIGYFPAPAADLEAAWMPGYPQQASKK